MTGWKFYPSYGNACGELGRDGVKVNAVSFVYYQAADGIYAFPLSEDTAMREALGVASETEEKSDLAIKAEAMHIVIAVLAAKAGVDNEALVSMLNEAEAEIRNKRWLS